MRQTRLPLIALAATAAVLASAPAAHAQLANGGFEASGPAFNADSSYCYASYPGLLDCGTVPGWTGTFQVIASSSGPWNNPSDNGGWSAAQGQWLAGLQNGSHMAQTVTLAAGTYTLAAIEPL